MSLWKLRMSMLRTLVIIIGASTAFIAFLLQYLGSMNLIFSTVLVAVFNIAQWLLAPYLIKRLVQGEGGENG